MRVDRGLNAKRTTRILFDSLYVGLVKNTQMDDSPNIVVKTEN